MKQEQLKVALCGYLPYEVYIQYEGILNGKERENYRKEWTKRNQDKTEILDIEPYDIPDEVIGLKIAPLKRITQYKKFWLAEAGIKQYKKFYNGGDCKPVLFNLNCLTKPIIVKGYNGGLPFVPIEEIAKIECPAIENSIDRIKNIISFNRGVSFGSTKMGVVYEYEGVVVEITHFRNGVFHKSVIKGNDSWVFSKFHNYPQIIEFLNMCLIDYRNLIGQGLAIDVETLKENCYE